MKSPASAHVLVAGDEATQARQLVEHLRKHFEVAHRFHHREGTAMTIAYFNRLNPTGC